MYHEFPKTLYPFSHFIQFISHLHAQHAHLGVAFYFEMTVSEKKNYSILNLLKNLILIRVP